MKPHLIGEEYPGLHEMVINSIAKTDTDLRRLLYEKIYLSGGSTLLPGLGDRLINEIKSMKTNTDIRVKIYAPKERKFGCWFGGSILACIPTFKNMWVDHKAYQEGNHSFLNIF